jgi:hypothetical protein
MLARWTFWYVMECKILLWLHYYFCMLFVEIAKYAWLRVIAVITHFSLYGWLWDDKICSNNWIINNKSDIDIYMINYKNKSIKSIKKYIYKYINVNKPHQTPPSILTLLKDVTKLYLIFRL